jgi:hypothetical protein
MEKQSIGFNSKKQKQIEIKDYLGKWVHIDFNQRTYTGKIKEVNHEKIYLLPHSDIKWTNEGAEYVIKEKGLPQTIPLQGIGPYQETTRKDIEFYCKNMNLNNRIEFLEKIEKVHNLEKKLGIGPIILNSK